MDEQSLRSIVFGVGLLFWLAFAGMTAYVISNDGFTVLTIASVVILAITGVPLFSSLREPPQHR